MMVEHKLLVSQYGIHKTVEELYEAALQDSKWETIEANELHEAVDKAIEIRRHKYGWAKYLPDEPDRYNDKTVWIDRSQRQWPVGYYHRENDKPAVVRKSGTQEWWVNGKLHRDFAPAIIYAKSDRHKWYVHGKDITKKVNAWIKQRNLPHWSEWTNDDKILFKLKVVG